MAKKQEKRAFYNVGDTTKDITLSVDVGTSQQGTVQVALEGKTLVSTAAPLGLQNLGPAKAVKGKLLIIETAVSDVSVKTNKMKVVTKLSGGPSQKTITVTGEVPEQGESILFQTFVLLKE